MFATKKWGSFDLKNDEFLGSSWLFKLKNKKNEFSGKSFALSRLNFKSVYLFVGEFIVFISSLYQIYFVR
jgi:hypothetical protein